MKFWWDIEKLFPISLLFSSTVHRKVRELGGGGGCSGQGFKVQHCSPSFKIIFIVVQELLMRKCELFCDNRYVYLDYMRAVKKIA
jgi:hypothetical protein